MEESSACPKIGVPDFKIIGLLRVRNESAIVGETLDHMASFCSGGIYVYDDASTDNTAEICWKHRDVRDVRVGAFWDGNRGRANYADRAAVLERAKMDASPEDWFVYMDADERIEYDWSLLQKCAEDVIGIRMKLFDYYITTEDIQYGYQYRKWLGPEYRSILMAFRNLPTLRYWRPCQREVDLGSEGKILDGGYVKHYGKAISIDQWEETCHYYSTYFSGYASKWKSRRGKAVHTESDFGMELIRWDEKESKGVPLTPEIESAAAANYVVNVQNQLKVLVSNHHLLDFTGSEIYAYTVADYLKREGHQVVVYSKYVDKIARRLNAIGIRVIQNLEDIKGEAFDVAHVHHNINAMEIRHRFPTLPIVLTSHGTLPFLEQPPCIDLRISKFLAVSEEVEAHLIKKGVPAGSISIFQNIVDAQIFSPMSKVKVRPQKALILSSRLDAGREAIIREALTHLNIEAQFAGGRFGEIDPAILPFLYNESDIVFSLGRGAMEAMLCARIPIVYDYLGADGMVTKDNVHEIMSCNFSGRKHKRELTSAELIEEIGKYRQEDGEYLHHFAREHFSAEAKIHKLVSIYRDAMAFPVDSMSSDNLEQLDFLINAVRETGNYSYNQMVRRFDRDKRDLSSGTISSISPGVGERTSDAIAQLTDLIWLDPANGSAHNQLGMLFYQCQRKEDALAHFRRAVELDPQDARACKNLALLSAEMFPTFDARQEQNAARINELEARADDLKKHANNLQAMVDDLKVHANGLQARADNLQVHADGLQAHARMLETRMSEIHGEREYLQGMLSRSKEEKETITLELSRIRDQLYVGKMERLVERMRRRGLKEVSIYGAGIAGQALARACASGNIKVQYYIDKNESLWGTRIGDIEVIPLSKAINMQIGDYAIGSFSFVLEIQHTIKNGCKEFGIRPRIYATS